MRLLLLVAAAAASVSSAAQAEPPAARVAATTAAGRLGPAEGVPVNATVVYPWSEGALYQLYAAPGRVTDIALEPGEQLVGPGAVAAGDTVRWIIGDTESGAGASKRVHVLVKPTAAGLATNLVINTDRRTYHLEARATSAAYMASVAWRYPQGELVALSRRADPEPKPQPSPPDLGRLNFGYRIEGRASWRPLRVWDDGARVYVDFPGGVGEGEMPPLFMLSEDGKHAQLVNYRVDGRRMIVDRLFGAAELRLGSGRRQVRVRVVREAAP